MRSRWENDPDATSKQGRCLLSPEWLIAALNISLAILLDHNNPLLAFPPYPVSIWGFLVQVSGSSCWSTKWIMLDNVYNRCSPHLNGLGGSLEKRYAWMKGAWRCGYLGQAQWISIKRINIYWITWTLLKACVTWRCKCSFCKPSQWLAVTVNFEHLKRLARCSSPGWFLCAISSLDQLACL